jgi:Circularly permutated YpsA SLOG family
VIGAGGVAVSRGTELARGLTARYGKPALMIDLDEPDAAARVRAWLDAQHAAFGDDLVLSIGGPRESEAPGIFARTLALLTQVLDRP